MPPSPQELVREAIGLPSPPQIFQQLTEVLDNPRGSTAQIADIIGLDSGLTARLLRLVNSAFYCFPSKVESISHAVLLVGVEQIRDLVLATSILRIFKGISADLIDMESFWLHSVATGVTARLLAAHRREINGERFFVAGVLHDIGRLLLFQKLPDGARRALLRTRQEGEALLDAERVVFGFDHATVGGALLDAWGLPPGLSEMVRCHHSPGDAQRYPVETAAVHVADLLVTAIGLGSTGDEAAPRLCPGAWERLGLQPDILGAVAEQAEQQVDDVRRFILGGA